MLVAYTIRDGFLTTPLLSQVPRLVNAGKPRNLKWCMVGQNGLKLGGVLEGMQEIFKIHLRSLA